MDAQKVSKRIIDKIQKCVALGQSPNENEAHLAMEQAHRLLVKYNLTMDDIIDTSKSIGSIIIDQGKRQVVWKQNLFSGLSYNNYCQPLITRIGSGYTYSVIGKEYNAIIVSMMYEYIIQAITKLSTKYDGNRKQKNSYRMGLSVGVVSRIEQLRQQEQEQGLDVEGEFTTALVVRNLYDKEHAEITEWLNKAYNGLQTKRIKHNGTIDGFSFMQGRIDSEKINLNKQIGQ